MPQDVQAPVPVSELSPGALFQDPSGTRAVKSQYSSGICPDCVLLGNGAYGNPLPDLSVHVVEIPDEVVYGEPTTLKDLPAGSLFETERGVRAIKSANFYRGRNLQPKCVLLESGEYAHFEKGEQTIVRPFTFEA